MVNERSTSSREFRRRCAIAVGAAVAIACAGCGELPPIKTIRIDGSSTVKPIMTAAAELFRNVAPDVEVTVGFVGTGGGFKKFADENSALRTDISDASRPITPKEAERASRVGVDFIELPIAYDGITVVVNPANEFCDYLSVTELAAIFAPASTLQTWQEVRPSFPAVKLSRYGPGTDSGTFDYFCEAVLDHQRGTPEGYFANEDDNVLVQGVARDEGAVGYFGFAYAEANAQRLKVLPIEGGDGTRVLPTRQSISDGSYSPLSRPLFIYVNRASAGRAEVGRFLEFFFAEPARFVEHPNVGYVALPEELYAVARARLTGGRTGSIYANGHGQARSLQELYGGGDL